MYIPSSSKILTLSLLTLAMQLPATAIANGPPSGSASGWRTTLTAAYAGQGNADLDNNSNPGNNGQFSVDRGVVQFDTARRFGQRWFTGFSVSYAEDNYKFSDSATSAPWSDIRSLQFGVSMRYLASEKWTLFGLPILRYTAEKGVDLDEGREIGLLAGASYRFSDKLTLGPGLGIFTGFGDEEDIFPILLVNWDITDSLSLETGKGTAASRGPGLALRWRPASQWEFSVAARYEKTRFRLDGITENIGEDKAVPVVLTANWKYKQNFSITALAGVETSGALSVEDSDGNRLTKISYDTAPLAGLVATFKY